MLSIILKLFLKIFLSFAHTTDKNILNNLVFNIFFLFFKNFLWNERAKKNFISLRTKKIYLIRGSIEEYWNSTEKCNNGKVFFRVIDNEKYTHLYIFSYIYIDITVYSKLTKFSCNPSFSLSHILKGHGNCFSFFPFTLYVMWLCGGGGGNVLSLSLYVPNNTFSHNSHSLTLSQSHYLRKEKAHDCFKFPLLQRNTTAKAKVYPLQIRREDHWNRFNCFR